MKVKKDTKQIKEGSAKKGGRKEKPAKLRPQIPLACASPKPGEAPIAERLGKKEPEQGFLFGEADKVRAALSAELTIINGEIGSAEERKMNLNAKISELEDRRKVVEDAMKTLDKAQGEKAAAKKPKEQPDKKPKAPAKKPKTPAEKPTD